MTIKKEVGRPNWNITCNNPNPDYVNTRNNKARMKLEREREREKNKLVSDQFDSQESLEIPTELPLNSWICCVENCRERDLDDDIITVNVTVVSLMPTRLMSLCQLQKNALITYKYEPLSP